MEILNLGPNGFLNNFLVKIPGAGNCLVDTGYKWNYPKFLKALEANGVELKDIKYLVITHAHADHVGFAKEFLKDNPCKVVFNPKAGVRLEAGKNNTETYVATFGGLVVSRAEAAFIDKYFCFPAVNTENFIPADVQPLAKEGVTFICLAGHTDADLVMKIGDALFCGDICSNAYPGYRCAPAWMENKFELVKSWQTILSDPEIKTVYPGHGKPFEINKLRKNLDFWHSRGVFKLFKRKNNQFI